jgi:glycosyltransferase involved in cell wall biosynthesis
VIIPEVSVIIPTRDRHGLLTGAVASAAGQTDVTLEIVVIDDGSVAPVSEDRLQEIATSTPLRVLRHAKSLGVSAARNTGIGEARGRWLAFLDDDDLWAPPKLRSQLDAAELGHHDFVYANGVVIDRWGKVVAYSDVPKDERPLYLQLLQENIIPCGCSNLIGRAEAIREIGGFDPNLSVYADWDFHIRLSKSNIGFGIPDRLIAYTIHTTNMHLDESVVRRELHVFNSKHQIARQGSTVRSDQDDYLRWRAGSYRASGDRSRSAWAFARLAIRQHHAGMALRSVALLLGLEPVLGWARRHRKDSSEVVAPPWLTPLLSSARES